MDYKIYKRLKEAGFPVTEHDSDNITKDYPFHITLSELIDACLEKQPSKYANFILEHCFVEADGGSGYVWQAHFGDSEKEYGSGDTKEQAVSLLWLSLNEKGN